MNEKPIAKYFKFCVTAKPILLAILSFYIVESGFSNMNYLLSKQRSTLNIECDYLQFKFTNLQPNINDLQWTHQNPFFPLKIIEELKVILTDSFLI